jgi:hypothetical protein
VASTRVEGRLRFEITKRPEGWRARSRVQFSGGDPVFYECPRPFPTQADAEGEMNAIVNMLEKKLDGIGVYLGRIEYTREPDS